MFLCLVNVLDRASGASAPTGALLRQGRSSRCSTTGSFPSSTCPLSSTALVPVASCPFASQQIFPSFSTFVAPPHLQRGSKQDVELDYIPGHVIGFSLSVSGEYDIGYELLFRTEGSASAAGGATTCKQASVRVVTDVGCYRGKDKGTLILRFDNSYSLLRSKTISLTIARWRDSEDPSVVPEGAVLHMDSEVANSSSARGVDMFFTNDFSAAEDYFAKEASTVREKGRGGEGRGGRVMGRQRGGEGGETGRGRSSKDHRRRLLSASLCRGTSKALVHLSIPSLTATAHSPRLRYLSCPPSVPPPAGAHLRPVLWHHGFHACPHDLGA